MPTTPTLSSNDLAYLDSDYRSLAELCAGRDLDPAAIRALIEAGRLPRPTYVLPDGEERFPPDYFALLDEAGAVDALPDWFRRRYLALTAGEPTADDDATEDWAGYLSGQFGICLWSVTVESMIEKNRLSRRIDALLATPRESDPSWRQDLRGAVDALDALLRPFTDFDRARWGDTSREQRITRVRDRNPSVFST